MTHHVRRVRRHVAMPHPDEGEDGDREREDRAHGERGEIVRRVVDERMDRAEEAHRDVPLPDLHVHLPDDPRAGEEANDQRREEVGDELFLPEIRDRRFARDLAPEGEHDERHVRREHPDEELAPVRDRGREPDPEERGYGAKGRRRS